MIATKTIPLVGAYSAFNESYTSQDEYIQNAIANCNLKALKTYEQMVRNVPSKHLFDTMTTLYGDSVDFTPLGYYTVYYSLYGFLNERMVQIGTTYKEY